MIPVEIAVGTPSYNLWDLVPAVVGGFAGAIAGGIAAYVLALRTSREAAQERLESKRQTDAAKMFRLFTTLVTISNSLANTIILIRKMYENAENPLSDKHPKQRVIREIANIDFENYISVIPDDMAVLYEFDQEEFANLFQLVINQFNGVLSSLRKFNEAKREVVDLIMLADDHDIGADGQVVSRIDAKHRAKIMLLEARAESIIAPTLVNLVDVASLAISLSESYREVAKKCMPDAARFPGFDSEEIERIRSDLPELKHGL